MLVGTRKRPAFAGFLLPENSVFSGNYTWSFLLTIVDSSVTHQGCCGPLRQPKPTRGVSYGCEEEGHQHQEQDHQDRCQDRQAPEEGSKGGQGWQEGREKAHAEVNVRGDQEEDLSGTEAGVEDPEDKVGSQGQVQGAQGRWDQEEDHGQEDHAQEDDRDQEDHPEDHGQEDDRQEDRRQEDHGEEEGSETRRRRQEGCCHAQAERRGEGEGRRQGWQEDRQEDHGEEDDQEGFDRQDRQEADQPQEVAGGRTALKQLPESSPAVALSAAGLTF